MQKRRSIRKRLGQVLVPYILLLDSKMDQVLYGSVDVDNCDDDFFGFNVVSVDFYNSMFGLELGSHILNEETRHK